MIKNDPKKCAEIAAQAASSGGSKVKPAAFEKVFTRINFTVYLDDTVTAA